MDKGASGLSVARSNGTKPSADILLRCPELLLLVLLLLRIELAATVLTAVAEEDGFP